MIFETREFSAEIARLHEHLTDRQTGILYDENEALRLATSP